MPVVTTHAGARFRTTYNPAHNSTMLHHLDSGCWCYLNSEGTWKFRDALAQCPASTTDHDARLEWVWTNAGFHRYA